MRTVEVSGTSVVVKSHRGTFAMLEADGTVLDSSGGDTP